MENLIFSLNATVPVFLMMMTWYRIVARIGWVDEVFAAKMNQFVFRVSASVQSCLSDLAGGRFCGSAGTLNLCCFVLLVTFLCIAGVGAACLLFTDRSGHCAANLSRAAYRSSAALLGIALIQSIYGTSGMAPLMIIGSVPLYNIMAVVVLAFFQPGQSGIDGVVLKKTLKGIVTNPIILGIVAGLAVVSASESRSRRY